MRLIALSALVVLLAGCGGSGSGESAVGTWHDESGRTLESFAGSEHCDWESATFLLASVALQDGEAGPEYRVEFVRDPDGLFSDDTLLSYNGDAQLPDDAVQTGFRLDDFMLWVDPKEADATGTKAIYVVKGDSVERWPRARQEHACA